MSRARTLTEAGFASRADAGRRLAELLTPLAAERPVVVALPRGGVPVAREVARALAAPLEILAVRKLCAPHKPEHGIGAVAEDGTRILDSEAIDVLGIPADVLESIVEREVAELDRRVALYRDDHPPLDLNERTVIVVDDGVATGVTDAAALRALRGRGARRLMLAVPVCAPQALRRLRDEANELVCLFAPPLFFGVGQWYRDFSQVSDEEVIAVLEEFRDGAP